MDFSVHWFQATVWASASDVRDALRDGLYDRHDVPGWSGVWHESDAAGRLVGRWTATLGVEVWGYHDDYVSVVVRGQGCELVGESGLAQIMRDLAPWRWRCSRIDLAWDGGELGPAQVRRLLNNGHWNSRSKLKPWFMGSDSNTCYSHVMPEKRGIERWFRVYDARGFNRFEWVVKGEHAGKLAKELSDHDAAEWAAVGSAALRGFVDFLDPHHDVVNKPDRRLHPAWLDLVGDAVKWRPDLETTKTGVKLARDVLDALERKLRRIAPELWDYAEAFGEPALLDLIEMMGREESRADRVELLKRGAHERRYPASREYAELPF